jgi:hypothetical protein
MLLGKLIMVLLSGLFWRMGGSDKYSKLFRRIGSAACMSYIVGSLWAVPFIFWGCTSYFGWINRFLPVKDKEREYWWNFLAENLVIQMTVLFVNPSVKSAILAVIFASIVTFGKVWMDENLTKADIKSEIWHGSGNALGLLINILN